MIKTCGLKPGSEKCIGEINYAEKTTGCGGCPCVHEDGRSCVSEKDTTRAKKANADAGVIQARKNKGAENKSRPSHSDGTGHLSDTKAIARSTEPDMRGAAPKSSSLRLRSSHAGFVS